MPVSPTPRTTGSTASARRAPSAGVSQGTKGSPKAPSATSNTKGSPTTRPSISTNSVTSPRGRSTASSVAPSSARARTASSPAGTKRSASAARKKSVTSASARRGASVSSAAEISTKSTKKPKPQPIGNFYLPAHNLSFASNPLGNGGGKRSSSVGDASLTTASPTSTGAAASPAHPFSPHDFSFSDPATIFAMSPSRAAATYERERVNYESRAASPTGVAAATTNNNTANSEDEDGPDVLANTAPSPSMPNISAFGEHGEEHGEATTGGDNHTAVSGDGVPVFTPPVLAEAPKFKSYFFGHPKPAPIEGATQVPEASHVNDTSAASPDEGILSSGTEADTIASAPAANGEENTSLVREASPAPAAPSATKIVSFDEALATAEANQAAYNATHGGGAAHSPSGISSEASPSMSTSYGSPASSASPLRAGSKKKASSKSKSRASSVSSAGGKRKGKAGSKKKKEKEIVDPEDCRPPGPVERLFGDVAKSGMTGAPTLASLAIAAHRTGSELDLKKAAAAEEDQKASSSAFDSASSVTPLQTANALFNLGWMHYHGLGGCGVNFKKAYAYFYDAATKFDHPMAHYYLGLHLRDGKGVERNLLAAHDAFQLSLSLAGGDNLKAPPVPTVVAGETATTARLADEECPPYKELALPAEFTPAPDASTSEKPAADADEVPAAEEKNTVIILSEVNKKAQTRVSTPPPLVFEGIVKSDVESVVNWQVGKLWANGSVVVLEEAPASAKVSSSTAKKDVNESSATIGGASRAASPMPATPRAGASSSSTIPRGATPRAGATKATSPAVSSPKGGAAGKSAASVSTTTTKKAGSKSVSKKAGASKSSAAKNKKDPTNNTGGGPNVVIKRLLMQEAVAGEGEAGANKQHSSEAAAAQYLSLQFRKVRYAADKPVAISLFDKCAASGFEHAGLAAEILRDAPIPRAEVE